MNKVLFIAAAVLAVAICQDVGHPADGAKVSGPRGPYVDNFNCEAENEMVVDSVNMCWYHQCVKGADGGLSTMPRRCALGSKVSRNFVRGMTNPCTVNFDSITGYDCRREGPSVDGPPPCFGAWQDVCQNGGTPVYEANMCWCMCPPSWGGDFDCSKPTRPYVPGPDVNYCLEDGVEDGNMCVELDNPCQNGGTCVDVCTNYWCMCPENEDYRYGKNCEEYPSK